MKNSLFFRPKIVKNVLWAVLFLQLLSLGIFAQTKNRKNSAPTKAAKKPIVTAKTAAATTTTAPPKVVQIDAAKLKTVLKTNGKPLLVNFWATWCDPCREEFPDLVKIDAEYRGKIDFITVSLDFIEEINTGVPKFLAAMKAEMPAYLLVSEDESSVINSIAKDWSGGLPFTILYNPKGEIAYFRQGKVKLETLRAEIDKSFASQAQILELPFDYYKYEHSYKNGIAEARKDVADGRFIVRRYGMAGGESPERRTQLKKKYNIEIISHGCLVNNQFIEYIMGYNKISTAEIRQKFGLTF